MSQHIVNHIRNPLMQSDNTLHVIGVVSNPARWHSRYRLFRKWRDEMLRTPGVKLYVVEGLYGDHHGECQPEPGQDYSYMAVNLGSELWLKENMINIGVANMFPSDWKYMCWADTDLHFRNPEWAHGAIRALQTYNVIQPWSQGISLLADGAARVPVNSSFGYLQSNNRKMTWGHHMAHLGYEYAHTGYAWCCTRYFWENIERKLIDFCLIGSADHHMAWGMIDKAEDTVSQDMPLDYRTMLSQWAKRAARACGNLIGYVPGVVEHGHHGPHRGRDYGGRWKILIDIGLEPSRDLAYDGQGVIHYIGQKRNQLMSGLISYNRTRNEDSIES